MHNSDAAVIIGDRNLTVEEVISVARYGTQVHLTDNLEKLANVQASCDFIHHAVESGDPIYGVTTGFGGMANVVISPESAGNSIMPLLMFYGNSIADRYPTHAEQYNQNINSQGFASANLARTSVEIFQQYMAVALIFAVQSVDLRTYTVTGHYDARATLSPGTEDLYMAVRNVVGRSPAKDRPYVWDDNEQALDWHISKIADDIAHGGEIVTAVSEILSS
ncbi:MAG: aromatic amino acid lyase, partial [Nostoc sp.]